MSGCRLVRAGRWRAGSVHAILPVLLLGVAPRARAAFSLTGTWSGTFACEDVAFGATTTRKGTVAISITQNEVDLFALIVLDGSAPARYRGHVQVPVPGVGAVTLVACGTQPDSPHYAEIISGRAKVTSSAASLKGLSAYEDTSLSVVGGTCRYRVVRTSVADPLVGACPSLDQTTTNPTCTTTSTTATSFVATSSTTTPQ
jgi:hypothetical protein